MGMTAGGASLEGNMWRSDLTSFSVGCFLAITSGVTESVGGYISLEFGADFSARDTDIEQHIEAT